MPDKVAMRLGAIILAGGRSRRMGRPKETLPFGGSTLLGHVCAALQIELAPLVVVRRDAAQPLPQLPTCAEVIADDWPEQGPLAAIASGLRHLATAHRFAPDDAAFAVGCDMPHVKPTVARWLADRIADADVLMPVLEGRPEPLLAVYRLASLGRITTMLAAGVRTPRDLAAAPGRTIDAAELLVVDPGLRGFTNLNEPREYDAHRTDQGLA